MEGEEGCGRGRVEGEEEKWKGKREKKEERRRLRRRSGGGGRGGARETGEGKTEELLKTAYVRSR